MEDQLFGGFKREIPKGNLKKSILTMFETAPAGWLWTHALCFEEASFMMGGGVPHLDAGMHAGLAQLYHVNPFLVQPAARHAIRGFLEQQGSSGDLSSVAMSFLPQLTNRRYPIYPTRWMACAPTSNSSFSSKPFAGRLVCVPIQ